VVPVVSGTPEARRSSSLRRELSRAADTTVATAEDATAASPALTAAAAATAARSALLGKVPESVRPTRLRRVL
jgi:hypothetical protein